MVKKMPKKTVKRSSNKAKPKIKRFTFPVDVYGDKIEFIYGTGEQIASFFEDENFDYWHGACFTSEAGITVWVNSEPVGIPHFVATLSHECLHAAWNMLYYKEIEVKHENHEVLAYLQGFIFGKCFEKLKVWLNECN